MTSRRPREVALAGPAARQTRSNAGLPVVARGKLRDRKIITPASVGPYARGMGLLIRAMAAKRLGSDAQAAALHQQALAVLADYRQRGIRDWTWDMPNLRTFELLLDEARPMFEPAEGVAGKPLP